VFGEDDRSPRSPNAVTKEWGKAMKDAGIDATLHSLRHTHASPRLSDLVEFSSGSFRSYVWFRSIDYASSSLGTDLGPNGVRRRRPPDRLPAEFDDVWWQHSAG
jgi:hypothetical protein